MKKLVVPNPTLWLNFKGLYTYLRTKFFKEEVKEMCSDDALRNCNDFGEY